MFTLPPLIFRPPEIMDDPLLDKKEHYRALQALNRIHFFSRTSFDLADGIIELVNDLTERKHQPLRILDVACGRGDLTVAVAKYLQKKLSCQIQIVGVDISERAIEWANVEHSHSDSDMNVSFHQCDVLQDALPQCDVVFHSLFLHHLNDDQAIEQLRTMASTALVGFVFSDLLRTNLGLLLSYVGTRCLTRSAVAQIDGPLSVRAARTKEEYLSLFQAAGLQAPVLRRRWPERVSIVWKR